MNRIHPTVVIGSSVRIGLGCTIGPGCVIGFPGFGFQRNDVGRWVPKTHGFRVLIEDDVWIGANTCVDRGSWRDTIIESGARIDNLVHIAHNARIGRNAVIVAQAEISGSVTVEAGAWIGPRACVLQRVTVGENALVGIGAVVLKDVAANTTVAGNPARVIDPDRGVRDEM